jgi:hypothetical protein
LIFDVLKMLNDAGLWGFLNFLVLAPSFAIAIWLIFFPKRRVRNLNIFVTSGRDVPRRAGVLICGVICLRQKPLFRKLKTKV